MSDPGPPDRPSRVGAVIAAMLSYTVVDTIVVDRLRARLDAAFMLVNQEFSTETPAPTREGLSGGPGSLIEWEDLGRQGRVFVSNAPTVEEVTAFAGPEVLAPVRAYVGIGPDGEIDLADQADLAVQELVRSGGFDRSVINIVTGTGRGWVNENQVQSLEFMWAGDVATVSIQYSYLPSPLSFLADRDRARDAGRLLFEEVYAHWSTLPAQDRPLLVVSGESLGSFGAEAAFSGEQDLAQRTDGALLVGPTGNNILWQQFTAERDPGSPAFQPVHNGGQTVRFSLDGSTWPGDGAWEGPRIGYLQHANDPITWFHWSLAVHRPDWLTEDRGPGVLPQTRWIPIVTFLQVSADQVVANDVGPLQGHDFSLAPVRAWAAILPPPDWTDQDTKDLLRFLGEHRMDQLE